jgi:hypothetical protein
MGVGYQACFVNRKLCGVAIALFDGILFLHSELLGDPRLSLPQHSRGSAIGAITAVRCCLPQHSHRRHPTDVAVLQMMTFVEQIHHKFITSSSQAHYKPAAQQHSVGIPAGVWLTHHALEDIILGTYGRIALALHPPNLGNFFVSAHLGIVSAHLVLASANLVIICTSFYHPHAAVKKIPVGNSRPWLKKVRRAQGMDLNNGPTTYGYTHKHPTVMATNTTTFMPSSLCLGAWDLHANIRTFLVPSNCRPPVEVTQG